MSDPVTTYICTRSLHDALPISWSAIRIRDATRACCNVRAAAKAAKSMIASRRTQGPPVADNLASRSSKHSRMGDDRKRSEEHTSELQSLRHLVCRLLLDKKKKT